MTNSYDLWSNNPTAWKASAEALIQSASILKQHRYQHEDSEDLPFVELLLWGYAVEVLLKCAFLKRGGCLVQNGKFVGPGGHRLADIAKKTKYPVDQQQESLLERMTAIVRWSGRYPIATTLGETVQPHHWLVPEDDFELDKLIVALKQECV
jgi:hypothetical protein